VSWQRWVNDWLGRLIGLERHVDPYVRPLADRVLRPPLQSFAQWLVNVRRPDDRLGLAEERVLPDESAITAAIIDEMSRFVRSHYGPGTAQRAGNTKTYGMVRGEFTVHDDVPAALRHGVFREPASYPTWVRFAGPGPLSPPDIEDNGVLSIGVKLMAVPGAKLLADERLTQDFTGLTVPTFQSADVRQNLELQRSVGAATPVFYFLRHPAIALMQGIYARTHANPLEARYWSCVPFLLGDGQAMQYTLIPRGQAGSRVPWHPPKNYLRQAMVATLGEREAVFDFAVQLQTDSYRMPIENAAVSWPERLSRFVPVATLRLPVQRFDTAEQLALADVFSFNPWHALPEHRPLGSQNRARREIYVALSRLRQSMNGVTHVEPAPDAGSPEWSGSGRSLRAGPARQRQRPTPLVDTTRRRER
jgi:hypothetical protein